ncbi:hypothetical protein NDU88_002595, partial [Pleurodeles waltl]
VMMPNSGVRLPLSNKSFMFKMGQTPCHRITFLQGSAKGRPLGLRTARLLRRAPQAEKPK